MFGKKLKRYQGFPKDKKYLLHFNEILRSQSMLEKHNMDVHDLNKIKGLRGEGVGGLSLTRDGVSLTNSSWRGLREAFKKNLDTEYSGIGRGV